jgi:oligopeptide/dipeptide ABC transporter ATP-binding protein
MCQRVMIAIALAAKPSLLIADEPTTGLDVTTQAVIMDLVNDLAKEMGMATIFITHDLALAGQRSARIVVMHAGHVVENAPTEDLFTHPRHPYTAELIAATPDSAASLDELASIPGSLPDLRRTDLPPCRYSERCPRKIDACAQPLPRSTSASGHMVACWNPLPERIANVPTESAARPSCLTLPMYRNCSRSAAARGRWRGSSGVFPAARRNFPKCTPSTTSASPSTRAKRSASLASPVAASRPWCGP